MIISSDDNSAVAMVYKISDYPVNCIAGEGKVTVFLLGTSVCFRHVQTGRN